MMNIERWGWYSVAVNVIFAAINLTIAAGSGSLSVGQSWSTTWWTCWRR